MRSTTILTFMCIVAAGHAAACSSAAAGGEAGQSAGGRCAAVTDSTLIAAGPVYRDCGVDRVARNLTPNARLQWTPPVERNTRGSRCFTSEIEFVVNADGRADVATARVVRASPPDLGTAMLESLAGLRFEPAVKDGVPVRQLVREKKTVGVAAVSAPAGSPPSVPPRGPAC